MNRNNLWIRAKQVNLHLPSDMAGGFNIGFDNQIPNETRSALKEFILWAETNFHFPVTLWVDFEYRYYLVSQNNKRVGFLFFWADFKNYPVFCRPNDIPEIRLPVRTEHYSIEEILSSFIEAITLYFAWLMNEITEEFSPNVNDVEEVLAEYLHYKENTKASS